MSKKMYEILGERGLPIALGGFDMAKDHIMSGGSISVIGQQDVLSTMQELLRAEGMESSLSADDLRLTVLVDRLQADINTITDTLREIVDAVSDLQKR